MAYDNPPVVVNALVVKDGAVLIGVRGQPDGTGKLELIGGFLEKNETLEEALAREIKEETNAEVRNARYFGSWVGTYSDGRKLLSVAFLCDLDREPAATDEVKAFQWVQEVPADMFADCDRAALIAFFARGTTT